MSVEALELIALICFIIAGLFLVTAVILFFVLKIPAVVGNLTGSTAKKAIEEMRKQNQSAIDAERKKGSSQVNVDRGHVTDKITKSGNLVHVTNDIEGIGQTTKMDTTLLTEEAVASYMGGLTAGATTVLSQEPEAGATTVLSVEQEIGATTVLSQEPEVGATTVLTPEMGMTGPLDIVPPVPAAPIAFTIDVELGFAESSETIE